MKKGVKFNKDNLFFFPVIMLFIVSIMVAGISIPRIGSEPVMSPGEVGSLEYFLDNIYDYSKGDGFWIIPLLAFLIFTVVIFLMNLKKREIGEVSKNYDANLVYS